MSYQITDSILLGLLSNLNHVSNALELHPELKPYTEMLGKKGIIQKHIIDLVDTCKRESEINLTYNFKNTLYNLFIKYLRENPSESETNCHSFFHFIMRFDFYDSEAIAELEEYINQFDKDIEPEGETPIYNEEFLYEQNSNEARIEENVCREY